MCFKMILNNDGMEVIFSLLKFKKNDELCARFMI